MSDENITDSEGTDPRIPTDHRPLGFWLRTVDHLLTRAFAEALAAEGVDRRDWMLLSRLGGDVAPDAAPPVRDGKRMRRLEDRGWVDQRGDGTWTLTDAGRAEHARLAATVDAIRTRVVGAAGDDGYAAATTALEAIARELGWTEGMRPPRRPGPFRPEFRFGFGPGRFRGFAPGGPGRPGRPDEHGDRFEGGYPDAPHRHHPHGPHAHGGYGPGGFAGDPCDRGGFDRHRRGRFADHDGSGHPRGAHGRRGDDSAYERGFVAGFEAAAQRAGDPA
ncbi:hypothetical protein JOD63_003098 [Microbacterium terrae]|uniref:HTH marR-type domain-containing protein n=1 Tax=Microbacterium terrae TaxID=69369 RepID=A0A0M2H967_9MICO|nr:hypothetical protein [Microbacterium terrae]KJL40545.1 hypothetical protein RS81_01629 [Microbacterium terrae]MBP1079130.1 hypothetical protein [Microbacterium terrae]GLJ98531.1 hypothetical protein GCM10017594_17280 [Microbacterium terrae]